MISSSAMRVALEGDVAVVAERRLVFDQVEELAAQIARRDEQRLVLVGAAVAGQMVEQLRRIGTDRRRRR